MLYIPISRWALPVLLRRLFAIVLVSLHFLILSSVCNSQSAGLPDAGNVGSPINGVFSGGTIDSVQLNNGNLHIDIPLLDIPGIGIPIKIHFIYDNKIWNYSSSPNGTTGTSDYAVLQDRPPFFISYPGNVSYVSSTSNPVVYCGNQSYPDEFLNYLTFVDEEGTSHAFNGAQGYVATSPPCDYNPAQMHFYAADSSGIVGDRAPNAAAFSDVILKNGTKYTFPASNLSDVRMEDSNGNVLTAVTTQNSATENTTTITDTIGRVITIVNVTQSGGPVSSTISYIDQNGTAQKITISYIVTSINATPLCFGSYYCTVFAGSSRFPSVITMQDGSTYTFQMQPNSPADLQSLTLPTGGVLSWTYGQTDVSGDKVLTRTVTANNQTSVWKYNYAMSSSQGANSSNVVTVTDPALNDTQYNCTIYGTNPLGLPGGAQLAPCYMTKEQVFNGSASGGSVLVTKTTSYNITGTVLPAKTTVSWPATGQVSETDTTWDSIPNSGYYTGSDTPANDTSRGNMLSQMDYDYGSGVHGALLRNTQYSYLYQQNSSYTAPNITGLVAQTSIYNSATMNSSTLVAQTTTAYDQFNQKSINGQSGLSSTTGTTNHDYTNFSKSATLRGLPTSVSQYVGPSSSVVRYTNYNDLGSPTIMTDPLLNSTTYSYGTENAFLASTTYPSTNSVSHIITTVYDTNLGLLMSEKDQNGQPTTFTYDARMRPLSTTYPDNGNTTLSYPNPNHIDSTVLQTPNPTKTNITVLDGLGRQSETQLTSDPSGTDYVDTTYDALGRVASVSNQYRTTNDPTYGITSYLYDPLGRLSFQCQPDNSTKASTVCSPQASYQQWSYSGNVVTFKNELGNQWQRATDALARLTKVLEPDPSSGNPSLETDYQYNALGDLTQVDQWGGPNGGQGDRQRIFNYDGLSRLTLASNPETGSISYAYISGSTLCSGDTSSTCSKTDARGVKTTYSYDALDRTTRKAYSNDPSNTPAVSYSYDSSQTGWTFPTQTSPSWSGVTQTNLVGRLSSETNGSATVVYGYDPVGRTILKSECTPLTCASGDHYDMHAKYDLAGHTSFADRGMDAAKNAATPSAGFYYGGLTFGYNGAGQALSAQADISDANHPATLFSNLNYTALGGLLTAEMGSQYAQGSVYDIRGRMTNRYTVNLSGNTILSDAWQYDLVGNVKQINDSSFGIDNYTYDHLNRLDGGVVSANNSVAYTYDNWGNKIAETALYGSSYQWNYTAGTNNRLSGSLYDLSGNMTSDGLHNYTYDGENRQLSVTDQSIQFVYDPEGKRVATLSGGAVAAEYLYDLSGDLVTTVAPAGTMVRSILRANGTHWGDYTAGTGAGGGTTEFRLLDEVGTLFAKADSNGNVIQGCVSDPFGDNIICNPSIDYTETHFTDKLRDQASNLDYFGARFYNSTMGRFMSPDDGDGGDNDPSNPQSWNLYSYVLNNPLSNTDPDGHSVQVCSAGSDGSQECSLLSNDQYQAAQQAGNGSLNVPSLNSVGTNGSGSITDANGNTVGTATYSADNPGIDPFVNGNQAGYNQLANTSRVVTAGTALYAGIYAGAACAVGCPGAAAAALSNLRTLTGLLPAVPSAIDKLQKIGISLQRAREIVQNEEGYVDNANSGMFGTGSNVNYIVNEGGKMIRITTDAAGTKIISAGRVAGNFVSRGVASGRLTQR